MNPCELTLSICALASAIACDLSDEDLAFVTAVLNQISNTMGTILAQRNLCKNNPNPNELKIK